MKFESGLEFGKNAAEINEAYSKMLDGRQNVDEGYVPATSHLGPEPKPGDADYISDEDFNSRKRRIEKLRSEKAETNKEVGSEVDSSNVQLKNDADAVDGTVSDGETEDDDGNTSAEENFYEVAVDAYPDIFNNENYDMEALKSNKKAIMEHALKYLERAYSPIESVQRALEEIEGCGYRGPEDDGEYDQTDYDADAEGDGVSDDGDTDVEKTSDDRNGAIPSEVGGFEEDDVIGNIDDDDGDFGESCCRKRQKSKGKKAINEGAGAGYEIKISSLKFGEVKDVEKTDENTYRFTATIVPGDYEVTADSYYDRYFPLGEWGESSIQIDGGEISGEINVYDEEDVDVKEEISKEVLYHKPTISFMYGSGWIHQFLPDDGIITSENPKVETDDIYFSVDSITIDSKNMSEAINYGYEHCNDEEETETEDEGEGIDAEEVSDTENAK